MAKLVLGNILLSLTARSAARLLGVAPNVSNGDARRSMRVMLLQVAREGKWNYRFMYEPAFRTIVAGFEAYAHRTELNFTASNDMSAQKRDILRATSALEKGDLFIWLGLAGYSSAPWDELHRRGVRTVFYRTEPKGPCIFTNQGVDETWDYTHVNVARQRGICATIGGMQNRSTSISRYLPPGWPAGVQLPRPLVIPQRVQATSRLTFLGHVLGRISSNKSRAVCLRRIQSTMRGARISVQTKMWTTGAVARVVKPGMVFLNLHRGCENPVRPFEAFRASQLIPFGALLISEHAATPDERSFHGIVEFETVDNLGLVYNKLLRWSTEERQRRAVTAASLYAGRFEPKLLFAKAGVYRMLAGMRVTASYSTRVSTSWKDQA